MADSYLRFVLVPRRFCRPLAAFVLLAGAVGLARASDPPPATDGFASATDSPHRAMTVTVRDTVALRAHVLGLRLVVPPVLADATETYLLDVPALGGRVAIERRSDSLMRVGPAYLEERRRFGDAAVRLVHTSDAVVAGLRARWLRLHDRVGEPPRLVEMVVLDSGTERWVVRWHGPPVGWREHVRKSEAAWRAMLSSLHVEDEAFLGRGAGGRYQAGPLTFRPPGAWTDATAYRFVAHEGRARFQVTVRADSSDEAPRATVDRVLTFLGSRASRAVTVDGRPGHRGTGAAQEPGPEYGGPGTLVLVVVRCVDGTRRRFFATGLTASFESYRPVLGQILRTIEFE